ncbi:fascin domain-containing protein [Ornithinimicrobium sp. LYQ103]|uniref:fascin domain-containing protein n=1 Tax=Ornithinimicrobium sp. LYQ103 TaxID=3378796 RepID=UPI00385506D3
MPMTVHIKTHANYYLQADGGGGHSLTARGSWPREWETLTVLPEAGYWADVQDSSRVRLRAPDGHYVAARGPDRVLDAAAQEPALRETVFTIVLATGEPRQFGHFSRFALRASDGRFVCAEGGGNGTVVANRPKVGPWETFEAHLHPEPPDSCLTTGIRTHSGMHFLQALKGGGAELSARGPLASEWETFDIVAADRAARGFPDGARVNIRTDSWHYLQAQSGGGGQVTAGGPWPREWETFRLVVPGRRPWLRPDGTFGLRAHNGQYVEAQEDPDLLVTATATAQSELGMFTASTAPTYKSPMNQYVLAVTEEDTTASATFARMRQVGHSVPTARTGTFLVHLVAEARVGTPGSSLEIQILVDGQVAYPGPAVLASSTTYAGCSYAAALGPVQPGPHSVDVEWRVTAGDAHVRKALLAVQVAPD